MAVIPVVLQFSGVAANYDLCLTLTTPGVSWAIGEHGGDSFGISYNALSSDRQQTSCIQRIEFTGSTLTLSTGPATGKDFTLTAFLEVPDSAEWLQGYCVYNEGARVSVRLGDLPPTEWRETINCSIPLIVPNTHRATFRVNGARQGQFVRIQLADDGSTHGGVRWRAAPLENKNVGLIIRSARNDISVPISLFTLDSEKIDFTIGALMGARASNYEVILEAYIEGVHQCRYCPPLSEIRLRTECDESVRVSVQIGHHQPQYLATTYKLFAL